MFKHLGLVQIPDAPVASRSLNLWLATLNPLLDFANTLFFPKFVTTFPVDFAATADGDVVARFKPGFDGRVKSIGLYVTTPATTPAKAATFRVSIAGRETSGGVLDLTSANTAAKGDAVYGSAFALTSTFNDENEIVISATVSAAFAEGAGVITLAFG